MKMGRLMDAAHFHVCSNRAPASYSVTGSQISICQV
jgi:hypothetical protein